MPRAASRPLSRRSCRTLGNMNALSRVEFDPQYTSALLESAANSFVRGYLFRAYGRWLVLACIVNAAGFVMALLLGVRDAGAWVSGAIALFGPLWLAHFYVYRPAKYAASAKRAELVTRVELSLEKIELTTRSRTASLSWSKFKAVVETPVAFLLVLSPFAFLPLPKQGMSAEAVSFLEQRKSHNVA